jgi:hypothetical protein
MIRVYLSGAHAMRTPLSYAALKPLFDDAVTLVDRPSAADLYVFAHILDIQDARRDLIMDWRARKRPVVLLSEEPFWDTIWGRRPLERHIYVQTRFGDLPVEVISHQTSNLFHFDHIPYYLLTNHRFANTYRHRFARNAERSADDWLACFRTRALDVSFMFERRPERYHWVQWPEADLIGLCSWRTELAEACSGKVERLGQSWQGGATRFQLSNWYLDKLVRLDGRARMVGAIENTHQPDYITEKVFDAFACGSVPLYYASPTHGVHDLGLPEKSWVNLYGMTPVEAAHTVAAQSVDTEVVDAFRDAQNTLKSLLCDTAVWVKERARLREALLTELNSVL